MASRWHAMQGHDERLLTGVWGAPDGSGVRGGYSCCAASADAAPLADHHARQPVRHLQPRRHRPWAVGSDGAILRQQGGSGSALSGTRNVLVWDLGPSPDFLVAVGWQGTLCTATARPGEKLGLAHHGHVARCVGGDRPTISTLATAAPSCTTTVARWVYRQRARAQFARYRQQRPL